MAKIIRRIDKVGIKVLSVLDPIRKPFLTGLVVLSIIFFVADSFTAPIRLSTQPNNQADTLEQTAKTHIQNKQYTQAEQVYNNIIRKYPKTDYGFRAYKELISLYIKTGDLRTAQVCCVQLLTDYSEQENIAEAACQIADQYYQLHKHRNADKLYQKIVEKWRGSEYAMWAQMHIALSNIRDGNVPAAQSTINKLLADYSGQKEIAIAVCLIADSYYERHKYDKANILYLHIINNWPDTEHGMWAQMHIALSNIRDGNETAAQSAIVQLLADYAGQKDIAKAVCQIADQYHQLRKHQQADKLYQKVVKSWPGGEYAMWSQMHLALSNIRDGNVPAAKSATVQLLTGYPENEFIALAVWQVAKGYEESEKYGKAIELNQYNVEHFSKSEYAMWSQVEVTFEQIKTGDLESAQKSFDTLITKFAEQETLPKEICNIAEYYAGVGMNDKATEFYQKSLELYQSSARTNSESQNAIWTKTGIIKANIGLGKDVNVGTDIDELLAEFSDNPNLPEVLYETAKALQTRGNYKEAIELADIGIADFANASLTDRNYYMKGFCYAQLNNYKEALTWYDKMLTEFPNSDIANNAKFQAGRMLYFQGKYQESVNAFKHVLAQNPNKALSKEAQQNIKDIERTFLRKQ